MRLLVVDDEQLIREGLSELFDWGALGCEVALAASGSQALAVAETFHPELVITDIYMPGMDGLELLRRLRKREPDCVALVLSGYNEFSYAREAIELGVLRYLSKPIDEQALLDAIADAFEYIDNRALERQRFSKMLARYRESLPLLTQQFLRALVDAPQSDADILAQARELDLPFERARYACAAVVNDDHAMVRARSLREAGATQSCLTEIAESFCERAGVCALSMPMTPDTALLILSMDEADAMGERLHAALVAMQDYVRLYLGCAVTFAVSQAVDAPSRLPEAHREVLGLLEFRPSAGPGAILYDSELRKAPPSRQLVAECSAVLDRLCLHLKNLDEPGVEAALYQLLDRVRGAESLTMEMLHLIAASGAVQLQRLLMEFGGPWLSLGNALAASSVEQLECFLRSAASAALTAIGQERRGTSGGFIRRAKAYIREQYASPELNLVQIAEAIYVNPAYLSHTFKQAEGIALMDYLARVRMDQAKRLLRERDMKTYEVAAAVGYKDAQYFSTCFRKVVGVTPTEYRQHESAFDF